MSNSDNLRGGSSVAVEVFCGVDVARAAHHAVALDRAGHLLADRPLPNDEPALRKLFTELTEHGRLLVVVDQPASIGALAIAVARSMGVQVAGMRGRTTSAVTPAAKDGAPMVSAPVGVASR